MYMDENGEAWFRGNLHTHTTRSDGRLPPEQVIALYAEQGYDFLALTDHWELSKTEQREQLLLLAGCEYDVGSSTQEGIYHIVGIGMKDSPQLLRWPGLTPQDVINAIHAQDGLAILAHPAWSMNTAEEIAGLEGLAGVEIYNTVSGLPWNARPDSSVILDETALRGKQLPCMAADDAHFYGGEETRSYLMVNAPALTADAILSSISAGKFYATQGPRFSYTLEDDILEVTCTPVQDVIFYSDVVFAPDRVTHGKNVRKAYYRIKKQETFLRIELIDGNGNRAWSSYLAV